MSGTRTNAPGARARLKRRKASITALAAEERRAYMREYTKRPEVKARRREYRSLPEVKEARNAKLKSARLLLRIGPLRAARLG